MMSKPKVNKKCRILFTIPNFDTAGSGKALLNVAMNLDRNIFDPQICCAHDKGIFMKTVKASGLKIPFLAISIIPLEDNAPTATPRLASIIIFLNEITLDPIAEFRKFTASLLTPTIKSLTARKMIIPMINI